MGVPGRVRDVARETMWPSWPWVSSQTRPTDEGARRPRAARWSSVTVWTVRGEDEEDPLLRLDCEQRDEFPGLVVEGDALLDRRPHGVRRSVRREELRSVDAGSS